LRLSDSYDVPDEIAAGPHSPAFESFLRNWFGNPWALTHGELDLSFLEDLSPDELRTARALIRRNLRLGQTHIIQGAAALRDLEAVPILRAMLEAQDDLDRRLTIAGALWNLVRDPIFITCLGQARRSDRRFLVTAHLYSVVWLDDERALDFLVDLLDHWDSLARAMALDLLNMLEFGRTTLVPKEMARGPEAYRSRRPDPAFREMMTVAIRTWNRTRKSGMEFGWSEAREPG
jgi:hypothetical protein